MLTKRLGHWIDGRIQEVNGIRQYHSGQERDHLPGTTEELHLLRL
jgi:hypothetical protein